jgi:hypothetical protein
MLIIRYTYFRCMWKVFGVTTNLVAAGDVWQKQLVKLAGKKKDKERFLELNQKADVNYMFDTIREVHIFYVKFPEGTDMEDLKFFEHFILKITKAAKEPTLEYAGEAQKFMVVISAESEMNEYMERQKTKDERAAANDAILEKEERALRPN